MCCTSMTYTAIANMTDWRGVLAMVIFLAIIAFVLTILPDKMPEQEEIKNED